MQALGRQRFGFQRLPVVTAVVFVVTTTTSVLGLLIPGMLAAWQRTPQGLHGEWWRTVTALLVQDGLLDLERPGGRGRRSPRALRALRAGDPLARPVTPVAARPTPLAAP